MKRYEALAGFAFAVLAFAAVWLGGLNQDEGWYLYAARLVGEGKLPYRDFFFTQGPVLPFIYSVLPVLFCERRTLKKQKKSVSEELQAPIGDSGAQK